MAKRILKRPLNAKDQLRRHLINDLLNGASQSVLIQKIEEDAYQLGITYKVASAKNIISQCRKLLKADWEAERKDLREMQLTRLLDLYTDAREMRDTRGALSVLQEINKITGQYEAQKLDVNLSGDINIDFGFNKDEE